MQKNDPRQYSGQQAGYPGGANVSVKPPKKKSGLLGRIVRRFFLLLFLQSLVFTLMFMVLPNKRRSRFMESLPGGVLSSLGWLVFSDIYSIYVENFSKYSTIYGSVYAIAITMLWLYCCMSILFYGGALNRYLMDK